MPLPQHPQVTILVADDDPTARFVLRHLLELEGYHVEETEDGDETLEVSLNTRPDLILLDAVMPGLDGFEICSQLQALPSAERIPVLIITGLEDQESVDRAFEVGAVDYVTKPIHWPVLRQRVKRLLQTRQLEQTRDELTQMIVHDMKNPISTIRGFSEMLLEEPSLGVGNNTSLKDALLRIYHTSNSLLDMTVMILDIGRLEEGKLMLEPSKRNVRQALEEVYQGFQWMAQSYKVHLEMGTCDSEMTFVLDWALVQRIIANLISNAIKHSPTGKTVILSCEHVSTPDPCLRFSVTDQGEGIPPQEQVRIFEKYTQASHRQGGSTTDTGLGLTFCKLATEAHGGTIQVESSVGVGSKFTIVFPG
ncbi:MAG: response regulator [Chloroflexota bacterium]